jgi:NAD+ diphosphatase
VSTQAGAERRCLADDTPHFPRTDPAVIVLVTDPHGRALLGHHRDWPTGRYSTLAGFVEPGESAEEAVVREVAEESQIDITRTQYLGSQPWPFPSSLMLGFEARASDADPVPDGTELADVRWFSRDEFAQRVVAGDVVPPSEISIAHALIVRWLGRAIPKGPPGLAWR